MGVRPGTPTPAGPVPTSPRGGLRSWPLRVGGVLLSEVTRRVAGYEYTASREDNSLTYWRVSGPGGPAP